MESSVSPPSSASPPTTPSSTSPPPSLLPPALFAAAWGVFLWNFAFARIGWRAAAPLRSPAGFVPLLASFATIFVAALLYQLVFRGWTRTASAPARFLWTILAPCVVIAVTLAIAARLL